MQITPAIVRFRGILTPKLDAKIDRTGFYRPTISTSRVAVVEFPPERRTLLVENFEEDYGYKPYRCQIPYMIYVIFYIRKNGIVQLDKRMWPDTGAAGYRRVCHFFRDRPLTSLKDPVYRSPFGNQSAYGKTCFGYDEALVTQLFAPHKNLHALTQTVVELFWGSFHNMTEISLIKSYRGYQPIRSIIDWSLRSKDVSFLSQMRWNKAITYKIPDIIAGSVWKGRFNPGYRRRKVRT